jgi:transcriptional regulator with XRE-family HTH domain
MSELIKETLGSRLKRLRTERNLTKAEVARMINVAETTYHDWETGKSAKSFMPLEKISQVLAISVTELVTGQTSNWQEYLNDLTELEKKVVELKKKICTMI